MESTNEPSPDVTVDVPLTPRLAAFDAEVRRLGVTGGRANTERTWTIVGALSMAAGVAVTLVAWLLTHGTENQLEQADHNALGTFGLTLTMAGTAIFVVMSLRRYLRYWLIRLIHEQREQAERVAGGR